MINNPFAEDGIISCQCCDSGEYLFNEDGNRNGYCGNCGARIDWPEDKDGWKSTNTDLPKYGVLCKIKYKDGREDTAVLVLVLDGILKAYLILSKSRIIGDT